MSWTPWTEGGDTPGGSQVARIDERDVERIGGCDRARFQEARERLFPRLFGAEFTLHRDVVSAPFPVDVYAFAPGHGGRDFFTLVTSGMSDRPMAVPADDAAAARRAELVLYLDSPPGPAVLRLLRTVATMPPRAQAWLGHGHTLPNGDPPAPLFKNSELSALLVLSAILAPECDLERWLELDGDPVTALWPVPVSAAECAYKLERGTRALLDVFNATKLSCVLDAQRPSLV